jgi:DNA-binding HxlR family transcriptional regulator
VSHKVLTETLRRLEQNGMIARTAFPTVPPRVQYALTAHGASASEVISAARKWGRAHLSWRDEISRTG